MPNISDQTNRKTSALEVNTTIPVDELCHLLQEYTNELSEQIRIYPRPERERILSAEEVRENIAYLVEQLGKLVDIGSAYHETGNVGEADRYWLELCLMRAESAVRKARRQFGSSLPPPFPRFKLA